MNCPYCQTPLDRGTADHSRCLMRGELPPTQRATHSFVMRVLHARRAPRVIEYRCANGHRVERTAP